MIASGASSSAASSSAEPIHFSVAGSIDAVELDRGHRGRVRLRPTPSAGSTRAPAASAEPDDQMQPRSAMTGLSPAVRTLSCAYLSMSAREVVARTCTGPA